MGKAMEVVRVTAIAYSERFGFEEPIPTWINESSNSALLLVA